MELERFKVQRRRLTEQVIEQLVSMIVSGKLKRGDKLPPEHVLMEQFGVGRSSIREAVGVLSLIGLLSVRQGHGTHVTVSPDEFLAKPLSWGIALMGHDKVHELVEARVVLEEAMAGMAAERATEEEIAEIRYHQSQLKSALKGGRKAIKDDLSFHAALAKASHNSLLMRFLSELRHSMQKWMEQKASVVEGYDMVVEQHEAILEAIQAHDVEKAKVVARQHLESTGERLDDILWGSQPKPLHNRGSGSRAEK